MQDMLNMNQERTQLMESMQQAHEMAKRELEEAHSNDVDMLREMHDKRVSDSKKTYQAPQFTASFYSMGCSSC